MRLLLQRETFDRFYPEALPLLQQHYAELDDQAERFPLDIDVTGYRLREVADVLRIYTARLDSGPSEGRKLIAYAVFIVATQPHHKTRIEAIADGVYVDPEQRHSRVGQDLLHYTETELRREGVLAIYHNVKVGHPALGVLCQVLGYVPIETVWVKRLEQR